MTGFVFEEMMNVILKYLCHRNLVIVSTFQYDAFPTIPLSYTGKTTAYEKESRVSSKDSHWLLSQDGALGLGLLYLTIPC